MSSAIRRLDRHPHPCCESPSAQLSSAPAPSASAVAGSRTRQTEIEIVTADGDRVTLSASVTRSFVAAQAASGEGRATAAAVTTSAQLQIAVEGHLDEDELADIAKVLDVLRKASRHHALRDPERLARRLAHADLDTLGQVSASVTTSVTRQRISAVEPPRMPPVVEPPETAPAAS